jgi:colanic acid biosynthesis glycosyl transferase WcaI
MANLRKQRTVFVNRFFYPDYSATSQILSDLAFHLAEIEGRAVHVVTSRLRYDDPTALLPVSETVRGVTIHRVFTTRFGRRRLIGRACDYFSFYVFAFFKLLSLLQKNDLVVAKTDPPLVSVPVGWAAKIKDARLVNWLQDLYPEVASTIGMKTSHPIYRCCRRLRNGALRSAVQNVVIGERMARRLKAEGIASEKIRVIHNWVDGEAIRPIASAANPLRIEWGLQDKFVVGYSGNMGRVHGFEAILEAADRLKERNDIVFLFIGEGSKKTLIAREIKEKKLTNVLFRPYQPASLLSQSLGAADVHLVTLEPQLEGVAVPSKFYGVLAAGRPVMAVGDPDGEVGALVSSQGCGCAVLTGEGLADKITRLASDSSLRLKMGELARRLYDTRLNREASLAAWREIVSGKEKS